MIYLIIACIVVWGLVFIVLWMKRSQRLQASRPPGQPPSQTTHPTPSGLSHRNHPRYGYLVLLLYGDHEAADRLAQTCGVEKAIEQLLRDRM